MNHASKDRKDIYIMQELQPVWYCLNCNMQIEKDTCPVCGEKATRRKTVCIVKELASEEPTEEDYKELEETIWRDGIIDKCDCGRMLKLKPYRQIYALIGLCDCGNLIVWTPLGSEHAKKIFEFIEKRAAEL